MSNGTHNNQRHVHQALQNFSTCIAALQSTPAGLSLAVPANRGTETASGPLMNSPGYDTE